VKVLEGYFFVARTTYLQIKHSLGRHWLLNSATKANKPKIEEEQYVCISWPMPLCFRRNRQSVDYSFFIFLPNFSSLLPHLCNNTCRLIVALFFRNLTLFQDCLATQRQHHAAAMDSWLIVAIAVNFSSPHCPLIAVAVLLHEELCQVLCLWATIDSKLIAAFLSIISHCCLHAPTPDGGLLPFI